MRESRTGAAVSLVAVILMVLSMLSGVLYLPLAAAATGTISGVVINEAAAAMSGVAVTAYLDDGETVAGTATTNASGAYSITGLDDSTQYLVYFDKADGIYAPEWYDNAYQTRYAAAVTFTGGTATANAALGKYSTVSGRITDASSVGIADMYMVIFHSDAQAKLTSTDSNGNYTFTEIQPGDCFVIMNYPVDTLGIPGTDPNYYYDGAESDTLTLTEAGSTITGVNHSFTTYYGSISGTVTASDGTTVIEGATVTALTGGGVEVNSAETDDAGYYRIGQLAEGSYILRYAYGDDERYTSGTSAVTVRNDTTADLSFSGSYCTIHGFVTDITTGLPLTANTVKVYNASTHAQVGTDSTSNPEGWYCFVLPVIAEGYHLEFVGKAKYKTEFYNNRLTLAAADVISVAASRTYNINADMSKIALGTISGTVTGSESGNPALVGISVTVYDANYAQAADPVVTNASGVYTINELPAGTYYVYFAGDSTHYAEYYLDKSSLPAANAVTVTANTTTTVNAQLGRIPVGTISGTVSGSESGNPALAGITVDIYNSGDTKVASVTTNASGYYITGNLVAGNYRVYFAGDANHTSEFYSNQSTLSAATPVAVNDGATTTVNAVLAIRYGTISGVVTGSETGHPALSNIHVILYNSGGTEIDDTYTSSGNYMFYDLLAGTYYLEFGSDANHLGEFYNNKSSLPTADPVTVTGLYNTTINVELASTYGSISGTVTGSDSGNPALTGITVTLYNSDNSTRSTTTTNGSGYYTFVELPAANYKVGFGGNSSHVGEFYNNKSTVGSADAVAVALLTNTVADAQLAETYGSVSGTVTGSEAPSTGLYGIEVAVYDGSDVQVGSTDTTDEYGFYYITGIPTGTYRVHFEGDGSHLSANNTGVAVTIPGNTVSNIVLDQAFGGISGKVTGSEAPTTGLAGVVVEVYTEGDELYGSDTTDASGLYSLDNLPTGYYKVRFTGNSTHLPECYNDKAGLSVADLVSVVTPASTSNINAILTQAFGTVSGTVTGSESGNPALAGVQVKLYDGSDVQVGSTATTNAGGAYTISDAPSGTWRVNFGGDSTHLAGNNTGVVVALQQTTTSSIMLTQAFGAITGTVRGNESGTPVLPGVVVKAYNGSDVQVGTTATTDAGGVYTITGLPSGTYRVNFGGNSTHLYGNNTGVVVTIPSTTTSNATLVQAFGSISGTLTGSDVSNPTLPGIEVKLYSSADALLATTTTDSGGNYTFSSLPSGNYKVWYAGNDNHLEEYYNDKATIGEATLVSVTIPSPTTGVNAVLTEVYGTVSGTVTGSDNLLVGLAGVTVKVYNYYGTLMGTATTDANGNYSTASLRRGYYRVQFGNHANHLGEWYQDKSSQSTANWVYVNINYNTNVNAVLMEAYGGVDGTVIGSESGNPALPNVEVWAYNASNVKTGTTGTTDANGYYTIGGLPSGTYRIHFFGDASHMATDNTGVVVNIPTTTTSNATLTQALGAIEGTVTGSEAGTPALAGVLVTVFNGANPIGSATTDSSGYYLVQALPTGTFTVHFGGNSTHLAADNTGVVVGYNQTITSNKTLTQAFGTITGTVTGSESGNPALAGIEVKVYNGDVQVGSTAYTNASGVYTIGTLPSGTYRVHFGGNSTHLAADNTGVVVVLNQTTTSNVTLTQAFGAIEGTVERIRRKEHPALDGHHRHRLRAAPPPWACHHRRWRPLLRRQPAQRHLQGELRRQLHPPAHRQHRRGRGPRPDHHLQRHPDPGLRHHLRHGDRLGDGHPPSTASASPSTTAPPPWATATTDGGGLYSIGNLPSGTYKVNFGGNSTHLATDNTGVAVVLEQTTTSNVTLTQAFGTIAGTVTGSENGTPAIDGITVTVYDGTTTMGIRHHRRRRPLLHRQPAHRHLQGQLRRQLHPPAHRQHRGGRGPPADHHLQRHPDPGLRHHRRHGHRERANNLLPNSRHPLRTAARAARGS